MPEPAISPETVLAIDIGSIYTRAHLFEIVDGKFRFINTGASMTTAATAGMDVTGGIRDAIRVLEGKTGRTLLNSGGQIVMQHSNGVDGLVATISAGPALKVICAGLLAGFSLESARHLAVNGDVVVCDAFSVADPRKPDAMIDSFLQTCPEVVIISGGTEQGAAKSTRAVLETISIACSMLPHDKRPDVLFTGNSSIADRVRSILGSQAPLTIAPNIQPELETENLDPARGVFAGLSLKHKLGWLGGGGDFNRMTGNHTMTTPAAFGRMIRFLGSVYNSRKGVLGIDLGSRAATVAVGRNNHLTMMVSSWYSEKPSGVLPEFDISPGELLQWLPAAMDDSLVTDYLANRVAFPAGLPVTAGERALEQALVRAKLRNSLLTLHNLYPAAGLCVNSGLSSGYEPVILSGGFFSGTDDREGMLLAILDGLQPRGITTLVLDQNQVLPVLGVCGELEPVIPVDVLDGGVMQNLASVIAPVSNLKPDMQLMHLEITGDDGRMVQLDVRQGDFTRLPLVYGRQYRLSFDLEPGVDLGLRKRGRNAGLKITAGVFGLVVDARGRPINFPADAGERSGLQAGWLATLKS